MDPMKYQEALRWPENRPCKRGRRSGRVHVKQWSGERWEPKVVYIQEPRRGPHPLLWFFLGSAALWAVGIWMLWRIL